MPDEREARHYLEIVENANDLIVVAQNEKVKFINSRSLSYLGLEPEKVLERSFLDFIHEDDREMVLDAYRRRLQGENVAPVYDFRLRSHDGRVMWVQISAKAIEWDGAPATLNFLTDITELRKAAEEVREHQLKLSRLITSIEQDHFVYSHGPDGVFTYLSPSIEKILGYTPEEFMTHYSTYLTDAEINKLVEKHTNESIKGIKQPSYRVEIFHKDGRIRCLEVNEVPAKNGDGNVVAIEGIARDITDQLAVEKKLNDALELNSKIVNSPMVGVLAYRTTGQCILANKAAAALVGASEDDLLRQNFRELSSWISSGLLSEAEKVIRDDTPRTMEYHLVTTFSKELWMLGHFSTFDFGGEKCLLLLFEDISQRKKAETERFELEKRLLHAQKLESLGVLTGGIAHDFNNLLLAIMGNIELAREGIDPQSDVDEHLEHSLNASRRAAHLVHQMLAYSGKGRVRSEHLDLSELVTEHLSLLRASVPSTIEFDLEIDPDVPGIKADEAQVQQVVMNLVTNAAEAVAPSNGQIKIKLSPGTFTSKELKESLIPEKPAAGDFAVLEVADNGCGMDEITITKLFEPFYTTKMQGRGLGMSAILGIIRSHNGALFLRSEPGAGTSIKVLFPATRQNVSQKREPGSAAQKVRVKTGTVLVVDDEEPLRKLARAILERCGHIILEAEHGQEAVEIFRENKEEVSYILLDLTMPVMDGRTALQEIRVIDPDAKVILTSGYAAEDLPNDLMKEKNTAFIHKPFEVKELLSLMESMA